LAHRCTASSTVGSILSRNALRSVTGPREATGTACPCSRPAARRGRCRGPPAGC
jgi:hypothetical protein